MKKKHMLAMGVLTLCGSLLVAVPSSFAVKSMGDKEMDATSAAGQSRIDIGNGSQTINDGSTYGVDIAGQGTIVGGSIANIAGENNVAVGVNVVNMDTSDTLDQENTISQQRNAQLTVAPATAASGGGPAIYWSTAAEVQSGLTVSITMPSGLRSSSLRFAATWPWALPAPTSSIGVESGAPVVVTGKSAPVTCLRNELSSAAACCSATVASGSTMIV